MNCHSYAFTALPSLESLSWLLRKPGSGSHDTNCTPSSNQDAYKHYIWLSRSSSGTSCGTFVTAQECGASIMVAEYFKDRGPVDGSAKLITKENAFALDKALQV